MRAKGFTYNLKTQSASSSQMIPMNDCRFLTAEKQCVFDCLSRLRSFDWDEAPTHNSGSRTDL